MLSRKTGRPVRLEYTLKELMFAEDTRNPFVFYMKTGVKREGAITALECKAIQRTGGYASSGPAVVSVAGEGIINTYRVPNYWYHGYSVYTSSPVGGEFRGFGHPQAVFAREVHMDEVAAALGMDPVEFRRRNSLNTGDIIETNVKPDVQLMKVAAEQCLKAGADAIGWSRWEPHTKKLGRFRRGLGMRLSQEHSGRNASNGLVWMNRDGKLHVPIGSGNLGTNSHTGIAVIVANVLGVPVDHLNVYWGDTKRVPGTLSVMQAELSIVTARPCTTPRLICAISSTRASAATPLPAPTSLLTSIPRLTLIPTLTRPRDESFL